MKKVELLAPAGSIDSMKAAINAGCDAVYMGGSLFGARAFADNPSNDKIASAISHAHLYGKQIYITVNTLIKDEEVRKQLFNYINLIYTSGADAVIVQDMGVLKYINDNFPDIDIHVSTQMNIATAMSANMLKKYGVTRIVTPRELSISEIRKIRKETDLEIETFIHGALCYSYSGQCLLSSVIGGRSGNRGKCAQPCRKQYKCNNDNTYLLSLKDMATLELLPDLIESGINSFKIEGRMKKPEYAALVTSIYRKYIDLYINYGSRDYKEYLIKEKAEFNKDFEKLQDIYNRGGFTEAYFDTHNSKSMMSMDRPNHYGVNVGKVVNIKGNEASIKLNRDLNPQDVLEIRKDGNSIYEFTLKNEADASDILTTRFNKGLLIKNGYGVYRIRNNSLLKSIGEDYISSDRKIELKAEFTAYRKEPSKLQITYGKYSICEYGEVPSEARKAPLTEETVTKQLSKLGSTRYIYSELKVDIADEIFISVNGLNNIRRKAIKKLESVIEEDYIRCFGNKEPRRFTSAREKISKKDIKISYTVTNKKQLHALLANDIQDIFLDLDYFSCEDVKTILMENISDLYIILPHILRYDDIDKFTDEYGELFNDNYKIKGVVVRNLEGIWLTDKLSQSQVVRTLEKILDYNVYTVNNYSKEVWKNLGVNAYSASLELNKNEIKDISDSNLYMRIYGKTRVMVSANCSVKNLKGCKKELQELIVEDSYNKKFMINNICKYCYNVMYEDSITDDIENLNKWISLGIRNFRIDFTNENTDEVISVISRISELSGANN